MRRAPIVLIPLTALLFATACGDDGTSTPVDSGTEDTGTITLPDAGIVDSGFRDSGTERIDAGHGDPDTLLEGYRVLENGLRFFIKMQGTLTSTMPPVVFLHTGPATSHEYLPSHMKFLLPGRLLVYYDLRASGLTAFGSANSSTISPEQDVDDLHNIVNFVQNESGESIVDLFGHGYGAGIAAVYAARHPERVNRLILSNPFPANIFQHRDFRAEEQARLTTEDREKLFALMQPECRGNEECYLKFWDLFGPKMMCVANRELWGDLSFIHGSWRAQVFRDVWLREQQYDWGPELAQVQAETTVISGPCDTIPEEVALTYSSSITTTRAHHVLDLSGHFPMVEQKAKFNELVKNALKYP